MLQATGFGVTGDIWFAVEGLCRVIEFGVAGTARVL